MTTAAECGNEATAAVVVCADLANGVRQLDLYRRTRTIYLFWQMNVRLQKDMDKCLSAFNMTPGQYIALSHLRSQHRYSAAELARKTGVSAQSMNELVLAIEKKGLIIREAVDKNPRVRRMSLTVQGIDTLVKIDAEIDRLEESLLSVITPTEVNIIRSSMIALLNRLAEGEL
jgi:DNA-binding MarR family transcriptional regulator